MFPTSGNPDRVRMWNIVVNAIAVMLVYSSYYGGAAIMPTAFADMAGRNGIDNHTAFTGLMLNNLFVVLAALFTPFIIKVIGLRFSLILGSMATIPINIVLFYPYNISVLVGQAVNGIGNAFTRAVSLQFLAENSTKEKMAKNSGLHWTIFMSCIMFGNLVLYFGIGNKTFLDDHSRMVIAGALTAMCTCGSLLYSFTRSPPPLVEEDDEETVPILAKQKKFEEYDSSYSSFSSSESLDSEELGKNTGQIEVEDSNWSQFKASLAPIFQRKNLYLLLPLCSTGIYSQLYTPLIPAYIGMLFKERSYLAQFGVFVGIGEILGGRIAGKVVGYLGFKKSSCIVTVLGTVIFTLIAVMFPLYFDIVAPVLDPNHWGNNALGIFIGIVDVSNNVIITTAIGTVFKDNSTQIFVLVVIMMNFSGIIRYIMMSYFPLVAIVSVNVVGLWGSCMSLCLIKTKHS